MEYRPEIVASSDRDRALVVFLVAAVLVIALEVAGPFAWVIPLKGVPVVALAVRLRKAVPAPRSSAMTAALLLGAVGDVTLPLGMVFRSNAPFFVGMIAFLVGHLFFIATFVREREPTPGRVATAWTIVLAAGLAMTRIVPLLGEKSVPVAVYGTVLATMAASAALRRSPGHRVLAGAVLFVLSDGLIGTRLATRPHPLFAPAIFVTYFAAQFLLSDGWLRDVRAEAGHGAA